MADAGAILRDARLRHGVTQRSLARRCRTSQAYISRIERGEVSPSVQALDRLLHAVGERLEAHAVTAIRGNLSDAELREDFETLTPGARVSQAMALSHAATRLAASVKRPHR